LNVTDKIIWDEAYNEEYDGLEALPTWEVISEAQYRQLSKGRKVLPTMAIATIKYDEHNRPKRAKYRLVVLGNHDCHSWTKAEIAAPVMSQMELHLLTSLAVYHKRVLKNCDIKQALSNPVFQNLRSIFFVPLQDVPDRNRVNTGVSYVHYMV